MKNYMKKIILLFSVVACIVLTSCKQEYENWYSATSEYDGRFVYGLYMLDAGENEIEYFDLESLQGAGAELRLYNTASNIERELWIEDTYGLFPFKTKCKLTGSPDSFTSDDGENISHDATPDNPTPPTALNQTISGYDYAARMQILQGKILPKAGTSIGGNVVDSIYIKFVLHSDIATFESKQKPASTWANAAVPEFEWVLDKTKSQYVADDDEVYVLRGYRYTGFPEDVPH
jgi:hypothetical protein